MVDLSTDMAALAHRLQATPGGPGRVVQFVAADAGEGTSTVARAFAHHISATARRGVWLVELDVLRGEHYAAIVGDPQRYGALGAPTRASPNQSCFFSVDPKLQGVDGQPWPDIRYLDAYPVGAARWWITRFRREALKRGQTVRILASAAYWDTLRAHADYVVIDAPALARAEIAPMIAPRVDTSVLVVSGQRADLDGPRALKAALQRVGGRCAGMVFNRASEPPPRLLSRLLPSG